MHIYLLLNIPIHLFLFNHVSRACWRKYTRQGENAIESEPIDSIAFATKRSYTCCTGFTTQGISNCSVLLREIKIETSIVTHVDIEDKTQAENLRRFSLSRKRPSSLVEMVSLGLEEKQHRDEWGLDDKV